MTRPFDEDEDDDVLSSGFPDNLFDTYDDESPVGYEDPEELDRLIEEELGNSANRRRRKNLRS